MAELSIIICCRNDSEVLEDSVSQINDVVTHHSLNVETLIVDDESDDDTLRVAQNLVAMFPALHVRVLARRRRSAGFGSVLRYGMAYAQGRYCAVVSSDGYDPVELLPTFLAHLRNGCQMVQCTRYSKHDDAGTTPLSFRAYQRIYRLLVRLLLSLKISDTTYGFRAFDRIFVTAIGTSSLRFSVCPEMSFKTLLSGGKIEYVPGKPKPFRQGGSTKFQLPAEIWGYAWVLFRATLHRYRLLRWF